MDYKHAPADVIRWLLINLGLGIAPTVADLTDWQVSAEKERDSPDNTITVYDTDGADDGRSMVDGTIFYHYGFQVRVRGHSHQLGWRKANDIRTALAKNVSFTDVTVNDGISAGNYVVYSVVRIGGVLSLGWDDPNTRRHLFTVNALVTLRQVS